MKQRILPIFIPQYACPFNCIFCNQKIISGEKEEVSLDRIKRQIEQGLKINSDEHVELAYYGGNFTAIDIDFQKKLLELANSFKKIKSIRISTRPDCIDEERLRFLKLYNVKTIELGIQSMFDDVLNACARGHTAQHSKNAMAMIKKFGFLLGVQVMVGLPKSTLEKDIETAKILTSFSPDIARVYPTLVIEGTYLAKMYQRGEYEPLSLNEAVERCSQIKSIFIEKGVNVIRVGLQPTEEINYNAKVLAGPFHPSFGELVDSEIIFRKVVERLHGKKYSKILFMVHPKNYSKLVGQKKSNITRFKQLFSHAEIEVLCNSEQVGRIKIITESNETVVDISRL
ncbi:Radical SAM domain protein [Caldicellulosiruptor obsidiansis OB47]|uniref:Radical SAM domain protein n=1 Tax=Caldicellulosiruptor obsidiansis (strain ATCC BAA-2073 / JCM 16842 / OB47) TaxID=608506 RepID=D9TKY0_CALOO|nr:radical SAM protein [Caldicellulosiruptor obsidiansis]ADL42662.1 Radical SAM domain protein [Caldicellulosiruptor obsidiansis OB47]